MEIRTQLIFLVKMEYIIKFLRRKNFWAKIPLQAIYVAGFYPGRVKVVIFGLEASVPKFLYTT